MGWMLPPGGIKVPKSAIWSQKGKESIHGEVTTIGVDLAKSVFQVHGSDAEGGKVSSKKLTRSQFARFMKDHPPCLVAMEACGTAHY
ncbi:hypothetical protein KX928_23460 [Roseobacter sp. YSTF-M11]|uniref:Transposase n=1 Tax=Roseobacter insulae TaxID=2859783 RepID=A0A9X1K2Y5_9RHOB|nr:hypothetical protein [Roseobacter insulae]